MDNNAKKYLFDILNSITSIERYLGEKRVFADYIKNDMLQKAVERQIEIIGEAVNKFSQLNTGEVITNSRRIIDTRNYVIHGYDKVDNAIIWGIIIKHLPKLKDKIRLFFFYQVVFYINIAIYILLIEK